MRWAGPRGVAPAKIAERVVGRFRERRVIKTSFAGRRRLLEPSGCMVSTAERNYRELVAGMSSQRAGRS